MITKSFVNKTVLVTGHTGFKGSWLSTWLSELGANVIGISNEVPTAPAHYDLIKDHITNNYQINVKDRESIFNTI
ncbi:NAD-dependent epimerase/dehydratase family protein, partial [Caldithrix abyssi]|nr:NAD-dependent epimerase/dehydratase family protein [Caldithrix abyssi]